jgi:hypothetical protein
VRQKQPFTTIAALPKVNRPGKRGTAAGQSSAKARPLIYRPVCCSDFIGAPKMNPIMAVAMTAREVGSS